MKKISLLLLMFWLFVSCQNQQHPETTQLTPQDGIFIHITHGMDDPHRVLMALRMAELMSEDKDVLVYLDIKGVEVVLNDAEDISFSHFPSSKAQLQRLIDMNIPVMACPGCLKVMGKSADDLMPGIRVAEKDGFFEFTKGRILTIDY